MLVYGDHKEIVDPRERLDNLSAALALLQRVPGSIERHATLIAALVEAGQLLQGVADAGWPTHELNRFLHALAASAVRSFDSGYAQAGHVPQVPNCPLPGAVELRLPEGFAFYAVYPEAYVVAARKLRLRGPARVIGIRSIGTTLGATVATALNSAPAISVRPFGDPFAREVELPADIVDARCHYVIVDEGPGLSGSSFGAVADWLEERGVPLERIAFVPSHAGDLGPQASDAHRRRWSQAQRVPAEFSPTFLAERFRPLEEFTIGSSSERRKFLGSRDGTRVLLKFAGLGSIGRRKLDMARALHASGFTAEPLELLHGFLVERWHDEARPLRGDEKPVEEIGRYIGARSRLFPADENSGASIGELLTMCRRNISLALGERAASVIGDWDAEALGKRVRRVRTDNKPDRAEWLRLPDGRLIKADAVDHHQAHDLIGCQGAEWDVAAAIQEFELDPSESGRLIQATGGPVEAELLEFYRLAYAAFRLGHADLGGDAAARERYARSLHHLLHQNSCARESAGILA